MGSSRSPPVNRRRSERTPLSVVMKHFCRHDPLQPHAPKASGPLVSGFIPKPPTKPRIVPFRPPPPAPVRTAGAPIWRCCRCGPVLSMRRSESVSDSDSWGFPQSQPETVLVLPIWRHLGPNKCGVPSRFTDGTRTRFGRFVKDSPQTACLRHPSTSPHFCRDLGGRTPAKQS